jgi:DNA-binding NarL/FixJ family response regulator
MGLMLAAGADSSDDAGRPAARKDPAATSRRHRLLVVEDEVLIRLEAESVLTAGGYDVVGVAASANEAVALARQQKPDLVLMDIRLVGERDGIDAAVEIREALGLPSIFVTAHDDPDTAARAKAAAPLGFLVKPYSPAALQAAVAAALAKR